MVCGVMEVAIPLRRRYFLKRRSMARVERRSPHLLRKIA